ncbi:hypothetical protein HYX19_00810 [Candidatus Woesearchaeota archaeon]|nr:hypothetical protein [Candidatus Woesearchaeota archaeon]
MLTQRRTSYYVHEEHPIFDYICGEIDIYDLPLEERITPDFMRAELILGVIRLKGKVDHAPYKIPWDKISGSEDYKGKTSGWLYANKCKILMHIPEDAAEQIRRGKFPDFKRSEDYELFKAAAFDIVRKVIELENLKK